MEQQAPEATPQHDFPIWVRLLFRAPSTILNRIQLSIELCKILGFGDDVSHRTVRKRRRLLLEMIAKSPLSLDFIGWVELSGLGLYLVCSR